MDQPLRERNHGCGAVIRDCHRGCSTRVIAGGGTTNNRTIDSITIDVGDGPEAVTIHDQDNYAGLGGFNDVAIFIASAAVPTGTTATVVVTYSGLLDGSFIDVYRLTGLADPSDAPTDIAKASTTGASNPSTTIDIPPRGALIGVFAATDATFEGSVLNFSSVEWTGIGTENSDEAISTSGGILWGSSASQTDLLSQTGRTVSATNDVEGRKAIMVGVWANAAT
jgi:hypothetical protein